MDAIDAPSSQKIAIVGTYPGDPRSTQLIAGFQSAILRNSNSPNIEISIFYIDSYRGNWTNYAAAKALGMEVSNEGYEVIFSALQNNNTLGILDGFPTIPVITVDSNRTQLNRTNHMRSIVKNNTKTILYLFQEFNQSFDLFSKESITFTLEDNSYYPSDWKSSGPINDSMTQIYQELVNEDLSIPENIIYATNTPGFEFTVILTLLSILSLTSKYYRKKKHKKGSFRI